MKQSSIFVTGAIINSAKDSNDDPFINFQMKPPDDGNAGKRHYFEAMVATTEINRNFYQFEEKALEMIAIGFKERKTLTINHDKGIYGGKVLGYGATVDAVVNNKKLYVLAYISLGKTYPEGHFGTSEQLRDGVLDGFINSVSQSCRALKSKCSVCNMPYPQDYRHYDYDNMCRHYRGQQVIIEKNDEKIVEIVNVVVEEAEAVELSFVQEGADRESGITEKEINLSLNDFIDEERRNYLHDNKNSAISSKIDNNKSTIQSNEGESEMSQETLNVLTSRAETAERDLAETRLKITTVEGEKVVIESQMKALETQVSSLEAEKTALGTQVDSANAERDRVNKQLETNNTTIESKDKEITDLKQEAIDNKVVIADGKSAREEHEKAYVSAYVTAVGDDCTTEDEELQKETCKSFSIEVLKKKTAGLEKAADTNYPKEGTNTSKDKAKKPTGKNDDDSEEASSYPIGV